MATNRPALPRNKLYQGEQPGGEYHFFQIAWIVDDLVATLRRWVDVYGVGPFNILPRRMGKVRYRGGEVELELQLATAQAGPVQLEFIQQTNDVASVYRDIYPAGTGGVHHLCTITPDYDGTRAHYEGKGYPLIAEAGGGDMRVAYFDTHRDFGFVTEVVEHNPGFLGLLRAHADTCARWDGVTDPLRYLCRGGYRVPGDDTVRPIA